VSKQRGDDMDRRVVVEVLGGEGTAAIVGLQHQRRPVGPAGLGGGRQLPQPTPDGADPDDARVSGSLQQVRRTRQRRLLVDVAPVARRHRGGAVEGPHVADDLGDDAAEMVTDRDDPGPSNLDGLTCSR
jgi:hypothetical protein